MIDGRLLTLGVYAGALAAYSVGYAVFGRAPTARHAAAALVLQVGLALHALGRLVILTGSDRPPDLAVAAGYVVASVLVLPLVAGSVAPLLDGRAPATASAWDAAALAIASAATVVVVARIDATWP